MPRLVAVVQPAIDEVRFRLRHGVNDRSDPGRICQIRGRRHSCTCRRRTRRVDGEHIEVLIAVVVLYEQDAFAVMAPEIAAYRPLLLSRQRPSLLERFGHAFYPDVAYIVERF